MSMNCWLLFFRQQLTIYTHALQSTKSYTSSSLESSNMNGIFATVIFGLAASLCWGSGDFSGGLASRRTNPTSVVIAAYAVGLVLMVVLALIWHEPLPSLPDIFWGGLAGF